MRYIYRMHEGLTSILPLPNQEKVHEVLTALACYTFDQTRQKMVCH